MTVRASYSRAGAPPGYDLQMMRRFALGSLVLASSTMTMVGSAAANGRAPNTSTINFRHGHETDIAAGLTFGLVFSHDNGATWHWMCEAAVGYGGMYDPDSGAAREDLVLSDRAPGWQRQYRVETARSGHCDPVTRLH